MYKTLKPQEKQDAKPQSSSLNSAEALFANLQFLALLPALLACAVLIGWQFNIAALKSVLPNAPEMVPLTALLFIVFSTAFFLSLFFAKPDFKNTLLFKTLRYYLSFCILFFIGLTAIALLEQYTSINFDFFSSMNHPPSPQALIGFIVIGVALLVLALPKDLAVLTQILSLVILFWSSLIAFAYLLDATDFYIFDRAQNIGIALHTDIAFLTLSLSILFSQPDKGLVKVFMQASKSGTLGRRLLLSNYLVIALLAIAVAQLSRRGVFSLEFELQLFASLISLLLSALIWYFAQQFTKLETVLVKTNEQLNLKNSELEQLFNSVKKDEAFLYDVLDNLSTAVAVSDTQDRYILANEVLAHSHGEKRQSLIGRGLISKQRGQFDEDMNPLGPNFSVSRTALHSESGMAEQIVGWKQKDNTIRWKQIKATVITLKDGSKAIISNIVDISELQNAKRVLAQRNQTLEQLNHKVQTSLEAVEQNEAFLISVLNSLSEAVLVFNSQGQVLHKNKKAVSLIEDLNASNQTQDIELINESGEPLTNPNLIETVINHGHKIFDLSYGLKNYESTRWYQLRATPIHLENRERGFIATHIDISGQVKSRELLKSYTHNLERSNKDLQEFAFVASHDLQEPLSKIRAFIDRLKLKEPNLTERSHEYLKRMDISTQRMQDLIQDVLSLSRVTTQGKAFENVDLNHLVQDLKLELEDDLKDVVFRSDVLPKIQADSSQIQRLFSNLISNSIKYQDKARALEITICAEQQTLQANPFHKITVQDNGIGFNSEHNQKIFTMFQRLHGRSEYEGTGVGLAICKKIIERHGGIIEAYGEENIGTRIVLYFPRDKPQGVLN